MRALDEVLPPDGAAANVRTHAADEVVLSTTPPPDGAPSQVLADGRWAYRVTAPGLGVAPLEPLDLDDVVEVTPGRLTNGSLDVELDEHGQLARIHDRRVGREILPASHAGAVLLFGPDHPVEYEAWDLESWTRDLAMPVTDVQSVEIVDDGPLTGAIRVTRSFGASRAEITYRLRAGSPRLDVEIDVDWHDRERVLSLHMPLDVRADHANCGIQFGHVARPTHVNTSWDAAKFEVCAHGWVDVSEPSFGVAVLDDGRYGHDVQGGGIRVTLLRSAIWPDLDADRGRHRTTVAILPHGAGLYDVLRESEALDLPLRIGRGTAAPAAATSLVRVDHPGILVSAAKAADDGEGLVVRLHEAHGDRTTVSLGGSFTRAWQAALTEEREAELPVADGATTLTLRPFELVTLRLV